jgi:hypothetical protein
MAGRIGIVVEKMAEADGYFRRSNSQERNIRNDSWLQKLVLGTIID